MTTLTAIDHRVFQAIARYIREHAQSPTRRDLQRALTTDAQAIETALGALLDAGCIAVEPNTWRNIRIVQEPPPLEVKSCTIDGCDAPRHKHYDWCHKHMKEHWRKQEPKPDKRTNNRTNNLFAPMAFAAGETVRFQVIDWVGGEIIEFEATATGNITPIPEREDGQVTRIKDVFIAQGCVMMLPLRPEVRR